MILRHLMFASDPRCNNSDPSPECTDAHSIGLSMKALSLAIIFIISMAMNGSVCLVFYKKNQLLTVSNTFVLNLICCQLVLCILVLPFTLTSVFSARWIFNDEWCHIEGFILTFCIAATQFTLTIIAVDRNYAIINSLRYPYVFTQRRCYVVIGMTISLSVVLSIPPLAGFGRYKYMPNQNTCSIDWKYSKEFSISFLTCTFILPLCIQSWCYLTIFKAAMNHTKRNTRIYPSYSRELASVSSDNTELSKTVHTTYRSMECKAMRTIMFIAISYALCWVPYLVNAITGILGNDCSYDLGCLTIVMVFLNTSIDPLIYAFMNRLMRFEIYKFYCDSLNKLSAKSSNASEDGLSSSNMSTSQTTSRHSNAGKIFVKSKNNKGGYPAKPIDMNTIHEESEPSTPDFRNNRTDSIIYRETEVTQSQFKPKMKQKRKSVLKELTIKAEVHNMNSTNKKHNSYNRKPCRSRSEIWSSRDRESFLFFEMKRDIKSSMAGSSTNLIKKKPRIKTISEQTIFKSSTFIQDDDDFTLDDIDITAQFSIGIKRKRRSVLQRQSCENEQQECIPVRNCLSA